jgi:hypothetical protein
MKRNSVTSLARTDGMSFLWAAVSRVTLLFAALVVLVMPWTEYFWYFDKFLRGGQDFELGLLSAAAYIFLILLMLQHSRRGVTLILASRMWICFVSQPGDDLAPGMLCGLMSELHAIAVPSPALSRNTLPLRV